MRNIKGWILLLMLVGLGLRLLRIVSEPVWGEEVIYLSISKLTIKDIVLVKHWLIDHPQLYILVSHYWSKVSEWGWWLRLPNIFFYLGSYLILYSLVCELIKNKYLRIIMMSIYAIFPYYVGIEWQAVPYGYAIFFFISSLRFSINSLKVGGSNKDRWLLAASLILWLYTSFEAAYYLLILAIFSIGGFVVGKISRLKYLEMIAVYFFVGLVFLPELVNVVCRLTQMQNLSQGISWYKGGIARFISVIFFPILSWDYLRIIVIPLIMYLSFMLTKLKNVLELWWLWFLALGTWALLVLIGKFGLLVVHPRAFYYLILVMMLFFFGLVDKYWEDSRKRMVSVIIMMGVAIGGLSGYFIDKDMFKATYLYHKTEINAEKARNNYITKLKENREVNYQLVLDNNIKVSGWYNGVSIFGYYFLCMDLPKENREVCKLIERTKRVDNWEPQKDKESFIYVGAISNPDSSNYFEEYCIKNDLECEKWDENNGYYREL